MFRKKLSAFLLQKVGLVLDQLSLSVFNAVEYLIVNLFHPLPTYFKARTVRMIYCFRVLEEIKDEWLL